jgi:hypothetical protein
MRLAPALAPGEALTELLLLLADAATQRDLTALEAIHETLRSLRAAVPDEACWGEWRGRPEAARQLAWLAHSSLWQEPL